MTIQMTVAEFKKLKPAKGSKYKAVPVVVDGIRFDSKAEGEFYKLLKADRMVLHVDVHPTVTLPGGIRYKPDFGVIRANGWTDHRASLHHEPIRTWDGLRIEYIEVKGVVSQDFRRMRKLFDASHPMAPLKVYRLRGKRWEAL